MAERSPVFRIKTGITAGAIAVYGSPSCGWTTKQLDYLKKEGKDFKFVDCTKQKCPSFVTGFPTLDVDGKIISGYKKI